MLFLQSSSLPHLCAFLYWINIQSSIAKNQPYLSSFWSLVYHRHLVGKLVVHRDTSDTSVYTLLLWSCTVDPQWVRSGTRGIWRCPGHSDLSIYKYLIEGRLLVVNIHMAPRKNIPPLEHELSFFQNQNCH